MSQLINQYYAWLSGLTNFLAPPLSDFAYALNIPLVSALLFGLIGATAPCQLSSSVATLAFLSRELREPRHLWAQTLAFVAGKITVYTLIGGAVVLAGLQLGQLSETAIPIVVFARQAMGPLLIVVGLFMLRVLKLRLSVGSRLSEWLEQKIGTRTGLLPAYLLGAAFAFAFCPTLFWLFFGLTVPLAIASSGGLAFPAIFALGTTLPILILAAFLATGPVDTRQVIRRFRSADVWVQRITGLVFLLVGLNETLLYWFL